MSDTIEEEARRLFGKAPVRMHIQDAYKLARHMMRREREAVVAELSQLAEKSVSAVLDAAAAVIASGDHHPGGDPLKE